MIVPNREFITGNLVNWTLKDKILRVPIKLSVAYGTDPDRVVELLLAIARAGCRRPAQPGTFGRAGRLRRLGPPLRALHVRSRPGLAGDVRHRLCTEVQRRFVAEGIVIPFPTHELHLNRVPADLTRALETTRDDPLQVQARRYDAASRIPPAPHGLGAAHQADENARRVVER